MLHDIAMKKVPIRQKVEAAALSLLVQDQAILAQQKWDASLFALKPHRIVFEAIEGFHSRTGACEPFNAIAQLEADGKLEAAGGEEQVVEILKTNLMPSGKVCFDTANEYRIQLREAKGYRDLIATYEEMEGEIRAGKADLSKLSLSITTALEPDMKPRASKNDILAKIIDEMEGKVDEKLFPTGVFMLDKNLKGGLHGGEMMTIAAETGGGKSILLVQSAIANLQLGRKVLFLSLEMSADDIYRRMASFLAGIPIRDAEEYREKHAWELPKLGEAFCQLQKLPIEVIDGISDIDDIEATINLYAGNGSAEVVCCDYIQIISSKENENRENAISEVARRLKTAAMRHKIAMFTASQLNDEGKLRESRAIGMHSDQVVSIEHKADSSKIVVRKNRRGPRNTAIKVKMNGELSKFENEF